MLVPSYALNVTAPQIVQTRWRKLVTLSNIWEVLHASELPTNLSTANRRLIILCGKNNDCKLDLSSVENGSILATKNATLNKH